MLRSWCSALDSCNNWFLIGNVAGNYKAIYDDARVVWMRVIRCALEWLERVASVEVFWNIFSIALLKHEAASWMWTGESGNVKDQIVKNDKLFLPLHHLQIEVLLTHHSSCVLWCIEFDWFLAEKALVQHFHDQESEGKTADSDVVQIGLNLVIPCVRVDAGEDGNLTCNDHHVCECLNHISKGYAFV